ncbi:unnamed protein product [Microthlaspi erraticum]|uniref:Reverse transcriptase zinc-binding domain-containing protein n=1 Tax=Microthlaspi erraticum TaxID=1685480 RepID=A0A6D2IJG9_9BRAS|nr:unnamed protein product [Microthlaspi erraticum]
MGTYKEWNLLCQNRYEMMSRKKHNSLFLQAEMQPSVNPVIEKCWKIKTTPKIRVFLWKALTGSLAVTERLKTRGIHCNSGCSFCSAETEEINHILFECPQARQVWALSNVPSPQGGFCGSVFQNISYLTEIGKREAIPEEIRAVGPWILWVLWKNRNVKLFEGKMFLPNEVVAKAYDDARQWSVAQHRTERMKEKTVEAKHQWVPPEVGRFKCNIGFAWTKRTYIAGASWVLRDASGSVICHSRRAFTQVGSCFDAKVLSWEWALQGMQDLRYQHVTFAASTMEFINALYEPQLWPSLTGHIAGLLSFTTDKVGWDMSYEEPRANFGASKIAKSVIMKNRRRSYVAQGAPKWMEAVFEKEKPLRGD